MQRHDVTALLQKIKANADYGQFQAVMLLMTPFHQDNHIIAIREHMVGYVLARGVAHRLHQLFSLFDRPQVWQNAPARCEVAKPAVILLGSKSHSQLSGWRHTLYAQSLHATGQLGLLTQHVAWLLRVV